jgi:hypothetical protein
MTCATDPVPVRRPEAAVEVRFSVDAAEPPLAYARDDGALDVEVVGPAGWATLTLSIADVPEWAGELFAAVTVAHRDVTGDPYVLTDEELATLGDPNAYDGGPGALVLGDGERATVRFHLVVDIAGNSLSTADLRAALVGHLVDRFNTTRIAVSAGEATAGSVWQPPGPA